MPIRYYANAPATKLTTAMSAGTTTMVVGSTAGLPVSFPYTLILDRGTVQEEAVEVIGATGLTLTVARGIDGTTAFAHASGAEVAHGLTARDLRESNTHVNANAGVHGVAGGLVGTSDVQTLTNKNLTSSTNVFPASVLIPTGAGMEWFTNSPPPGWLLQDGSAVSRTTYAALYAVIGTTYGAGDGATTFNLPNKSGKVGVGRDSTQAEFDTLGETGGEKTHTLNINEMPSHGHGINDPGHSHPYYVGHAEIGTLDWSYVNGAGRAFNTGPNWTTDNAGTGISIQNAGGGGAHNNLQPYLVHNYIIKT